MQHNRLPGDSFLPQNKHTERMQRGLGNPQARGGSATRDIAKVIERKFAHMQTSFQREGMVATLRKADSGARDNVLTLVGRKLESLSAQFKATKDVPEQEQLRAQMSAWNHWKVQFEAKGLENTDSDATKDFFAWLLGRGKEDHHRQTPWYRQQALLDLPDVQQWVDGFADIWTESVDELKKLAWKTPQNLDEAWLYFKFIVQTDWMKREDRFFWVDLVNLMNEKAKLGGGLLREEIRTAQPYIRTTENGETGILPLSENDVFDAKEVGAVGVRDPLSDAQLATVKATLGRQLEHWSTINNLTKDARRTIKIKPPKKSEIDTYAAAIQMDDEALAKKIHDIDWTVKKSGGDVESSRLASLYHTMASMAQSVTGDETSGSPFTTDFTDDQQAILVNASRYIQKAGMGAEKNKPVFVPEGPYGQLEQVSGSTKIGYSTTLNYIDGAQQGIKELMTSKLTDDDRLRFKAINDSLQFARYGLEFKLEGERATFRGADGSEINAQAALAMVLRPPDPRDLVDGVNKAVSKALQDSPGLLGKTMSTEEKGRLQSTARMAKVMGEFLEARTELYRSYAPRGEAEAAFVESVLEERWRMWLSAANITGELALSMGTAPRNPIQMAQMYETMLGSIRERSDLLWKYIISDEGGALRRAYAFQNVPFLEAAVDRFNAKLDKHGITMSDTARALFMDPNDHAQINLMAKMWKGMYDRSDWERSWNSVWEYLEQTGVALKSTSGKIARTTASFAVGQAGTWLVRVAIPTDGGMRWAATLGIQFAAKMAFGAMGTPTAAAMFTNLVWMGAANLMKTVVPGVVHEAPIRLATGIIANTFNMHRQGQEAETMADFAARYGGTFDTLAMALPTTLLGPFTDYAFGSGMGRKMTDLFGGLVAKFWSEPHIDNPELPVLVRELFGDKSKLELFLTHDARKVEPSVPPPGVTPRPDWVGGVAGYPDSYRQFNPETGKYERFASGYLEKFGVLQDAFPEGLDPKFKPAWETTNSPFVRTTLAALSNNWFAEADRLHQAVKVANGLNLTALDLFDDKVAWQSKVGIFAQTVLTLGSPFWTALNGSRVELLKDISQLNKLDIRDVYMDYASQRARQRIEGRMRDLAGARRLKALNPKKKLGKRKQQALDARTGEGLVKKSGNTRVAVQ